MWKHHFKTIEPDVTNTNIIDKTSGSVEPTFFLFASLKIQNPKVDRSMANLKP